MVLEESGGAEPRWVRTKVVVDNHIVIPDLEDQRRAAAAASPDQVVEDYVASLTSAPMDRSRPLWDLHILNFPTSDAAAVTVLRVHHSLGDGTSLMSLLLACTRKASDPDSLPTIPHQSRRPLASRKLHAGGGAFTLLLWLWAFLILAWNTLLDVLRFTATSTFSKDTPTPLTGPKGVEYHPKRIVHRTVSLDDIKDVKNAMHCVGRPSLSPSSFTP
ncbi:hypothetical protein B296_00026708 [Ensete ventricosum]|uniref:diacylglycerol O-acyltransferase n=1 Tax=Ensete ventricosum TaxID=4639 RepID=A0A426YEM4_ENSVE|nr:hypothetical protein B296_00026708 [Ensete ventricosum]